MAENEKVQESSFVNPSVDAIKSRVAAGGDLLKQYNFKVNIPRLKPDGNRELNDILQETSLPSKTHATQPVYYGGPLTQVPYITSYPGTISMTLICPETSVVRDTFYKWLDSVVYAKSGMVNYRNEYVDPNITIELTKSPKKFSTDTSEAIKYTLFDVFPDSINEISLTQNARDDYVRMSVVLMYRKWIKGLAVDQVVPGPRERLQTQGEVTPTPRSAEEASLNPDNFVGDQIRWSGV